MANNLTNLEDDMIEEIFSRLSPQDSANLSQAHPELGRIYRRRIMLDLENAENWEGFVAVVDEVLDNHAGGQPLDRLSIRLPVVYYIEQHVIDTAVSRWMFRARVLRVSNLDLRGNPVSCWINVNFIAWEDLRDVSLHWVRFPDGELFQLQLLITPPLNNLLSLELQHVRIEPHTNIGLLLEACPNLQFFKLEDCYGHGDLNINCPSLQTLDISDLYEWTVTISNLPFLTHFNVCSQDLPQFRLLEHPISTAPIPPSAQDSVAIVPCLFIAVEDNLPTVVQFIQYFQHSIYHLIFQWNVPAHMEYQVDDMQELEELDSITIGGVPLYDEPLRVMVEYILAHSPKLSSFTLMVPPHPNPQFLEENYLSEIEHTIKELPRSSQQVQFEFIQY